jgi:uncharacterized protein with HEPN domain
MSRDFLLFLADIEKSAAKIVEHTSGRARDECLADDLRFDGILFNLQIIGEAVKKLPVDLRQRYPDVPWREIAGLRDFVAHAYFALDVEILWDAIQNDIPSLLARVREILQAEAGRNEGNLENPPAGGGISG